MNPLTLFKIITSDLDGEYTHEVWAQSKAEARSLVELGSNEMFEGKITTSENHVDGVYR